MLKNKLPLVSIIIVNYNGKKYLEKCLESLVKINYDNYEIIVIDNNSSDGSISFIEKYYPQINLKKLDQNYGFAKPNNLGAKIAKGKFMLFLNNDTIVTSNFVSELVEAISTNENIAICQSCLLKINGDVDSSGDFVDSLGRAYSSREKNPPFHNILSARGASMLIKTDLFYELKGFDENFFVSFEDVDLGWRANIYGYDVVLAPKSIVYHLGGQTIRNINTQIQFHSVKNSLILRLTNFELNYLAKCLIYLPFILLVRKLFKISVINDPEKSPPLPSMKIILKGTLWTLKNLGYILKKRKQVNFHRHRSTTNLMDLGLITKY